MKHPHILRLLFALSFLFSAYTKFVAPGYFEITLMDQGIASSRELAAHLTRFFIGLEFALRGFAFLPVLYQKSSAFFYWSLGCFQLAFGLLVFPWRQLKLRLLWRDDIHEPSAIITKKRNLTFGGVLVIFQKGKRNTVKTHLFSVCCDYSCKHVALSPFTGKRRTKI